MIGCIGVLGISALVTYFCDTGGSGIAQEFTDTGIRMAVESPMENKGSRGMGYANGFSAGLLLRAAC